MQAHRSDEREVLTPVPGHLRVSPLSCGRPRPQPIHGDVKSALVHEHQPSHIEASEEPLPKPSRPLVALGGYFRLFLSGHSPGRRAIWRLIVASETSTPASSKNASQCSLRVRSGFFSKCFSSHSLKALPFTDGLPGIFFVPTPPVWRLLFNQRLMVERETPKRSATSFLGMPRLTAASTLNLRSFE